MKEKVSENLLRQKNELNEKWPEIEETMLKAPESADLLESREVFVSMVQREIRTSGNDYLAVIKGLRPQAREKGTQWLQGYVGMVSRSAFNLLPGYGIVYK
jgi:hypothetical protein